MGLINWNSDLESGIEMIDEQHKKFVRSANHFYIKCQFQKNREAAEEELAFLEQYLLYHLQAEEAFQIQNDYPKFREHQAVHDTLRIQVKALSIQLREQDFSDETMAEFCRFISKWVAQHIEVEDKAFSVYLKKKRSGK